MDAAAVHHLQLCRNTPVRHWRRGAKKIIQERAVPAGERVTMEIHA
jgi:hypothetical protein